MARQTRRDEEIEILKGTFNYWSSGQGSNQEARESGAVDCAQMAQWCKDELATFGVDPEEDEDE